MLRNPLQNVAKSAAIFSEIQHPGGFPRDYCTSTGFSIGKRRQTQLVVVLLMASHDSPGLPYMQRTLLVLVIHFLFYIRDWLKEHDAPTDNDVGWGCLRDNDLSD